jgi:hypothetical protein
MWFSLDVIRARKGDCLMLHYGSEDERHLMMIDGGPRGVYGPHLRPRIECVKAERGLDKSQPLPVDVLMVSHVDDDHIQGILDLTKELITASMARGKPLVNIADLWHNSFENIINGSTDELTASFKKQFGEASTTTELPDDITVDVADEDEEVILWNLKAFASIAQGARLRSDADRLSIPLNSLVAGELIVATKNAEPITMDGLTLTVIGPMHQEIEELRKKHEAWRIELKTKPMTPEKALAAYVDKSVPNLSSIVMLIEAGPAKAKKRILLTGDARGDRILCGLELAKLCDAAGNIKIDILKVPHHGSSNDLDNDFFERIIADHYVFSGDGEHGNPERESLQMLWDARGNDEYQVHLTYPITEIDKERKADWVKEQNKERKKKANNPKKQVRPNWSPAKHGLKAFFEQNPEFAKKVRIVDADEPHLIDLLDPLAL